METLEAGGCGLVGHGSTSVPFVARAIRRPFFVP
jgi:hypothetical protein